MNFDSRKTVKITGWKTGKLSAQWQKYSENPAWPTVSPSCFIIYEMLWMHIYFLSLFCDIFPTCLEIEAAWVLINGLKFSLVLQQRLHTSLHPPEMPFVRCAEMLLHESVRQALSPYRKGSGCLPFRSSRVLHFGEMTQTLKRGQCIFA